MVKKWLIAGAVFVIVMLVIGGGCGWAGMKLGRAIIEGLPGDFSRYYPVTSWCGNGLPFVDRLPAMLDGKTYAVMLLNNKELRPSGGFLGSYVLVKTGNGVIKEWTVKDVYDADGKLPGHVEPPYPVQESFKQGWWKLRDADWDPDFSSGAATIAWFMDQGGDHVDGMVALNLDFVEKWLSIMGPVKVFSYDRELTADNFYTLAQSSAQVGWVPGSTQKRDFLGAAGVALAEETKKANPSQLVKLAREVWRQLKTGQMMLWFEDKDLQKTVAEKHWDGGWGKGWGDYLYVAEANLGSNKSNCCVTRSVIQEITGDEEKIRIDWKNTSKYQNPVPEEDFWGGNYLNYLRVVVPSGAEVAEVTVGGEKLRRAVEADFAFPNSLRQRRTMEMYAVEERGDLQLIGFWADVPAGGENWAQVTLTRAEKPRSYSIRIRRQPGIAGFDYRLTVDGKEIWKGWIDKNMDLGVK